MGRGDDPGGSPPCFLHELEAGAEGFVAVDPQQARDVARWRKAERAFSDTISATLDLYRDFRDAASELWFFEIYGTLFSVYLADRPEKQDLHRASASSPRESAIVKAALDGLETGGYPAALARVAAGRQQVGRRRIHSQAERPGPPVDEAGGGGERHRGQRRQQQAGTRQDGMQPANGA